MKYIIFLTALLSFISCQNVSPKAGILSTELFFDSSAVKNDDADISAIHKIDFQNFTYPWTKTFGGKDKSFTLKNGFAESSNGEKLSLKSLSFVDIADDYDEQALVVVKIDDGDATYNLLYVYAVENNKPKLLGSFEFGANNIFFGTAFDAHRELVIETYHQLAGDAECCPSIIEISHYQWQKSKFVLQGESQKISNSYVERIKKKRSN